VDLRRNWGSGRHRFTPHSRFWPHF
jgi:hypothetical protein